VLADVDDVQRAVDQGHGTEDKRRRGTQPSPHPREEEDGRNRDDPDGQEAPEVLGKGNTRLPVEDRVVNRVEEP
jgi:hypothetical protein